MSMRYNEAVTLRLPDDRSCECWFQGSARQERPGGIPGLWNWHGTITTENHGLLSDALEAGEDVTLEFADGVSAQALISGLKHSWRAGIGASFLGTVTGQGGPPRAQ